MYYVRRRDFYNLVFHDFSLKPKLVWKHPDPSELFFIAYHASNHTSFASQWTGLNEVTEMGAKNRVNSCEGSIPIKVESRAKGKKARRFC